MALKLNFKLPDKLYIKDPQDSAYGQRLLSNAIELIDELGFEAFTFKKLGNKMESSEVSIYRYFENKHLLLLYLNCWYWEWVCYLIDMKVMNIKNSKEKLQIAIHAMIHANSESKLIDYINEKLLFQIVIKEGSKTYHISSINEENKHGFFTSYKELIFKVSGIIEEIKPEFKYSKSLASSLFEMINNQLYYAEHMPKLTSISKRSSAKELEKMINHFAFGAIGYNEK